MPVAMPARSPYAEALPPQALRPWVRRLWELESGGSPQRVLPDGCTDVLFQWEEGEKVARTQVVGVMTRALVTPAGPRVRLLGIRLQPWAVRSVLGLPGGELRDRAASLEDVWGARGRRLLESLAQAVGVEAQQRLLVTELLRLLLPQTPPAPAAVSAAVALLEAAPGGLSVGGLSQAVGWGERRLERAFEAHVGVSPKGLARIFRLQRAVQGLGRGSDGELAASTGYADQAHLIRDFRALTGLTPRQLAAERLSDSFNPPAPPAASLVANSFGE
jgi:AraC-like DNA-binding protein